MLLRKAEKRLRKAAVQVRAARNRHAAVLRHAGRRVKALLYAKRHVERDGVVRRQAVSRRQRARPADLLARARHRGDVHGKRAVRNRVKRQQDRRDRRAVVNRRGRMWPPASSSSRGRYVTTSPGETSSQARSCG